MRHLISTYEKSLALLVQRTKELRQIYNRLEKEGKTEEIKEQDLERRMRLLYIERKEHREIIKHLKQYLLWVERRNQGGKL